MDEIDIHNSVEAQRDIAISISIFISISIAIAVTVAIAVDIDMDAKLDDSVDFSEFTRRVASLPWSSEIARKPSEEIGLEMG